MNSAVKSHQQEEGVARTGVPQKDVKARRRSVMDIFLDSLHHAPSSGGPSNFGMDSFPENDVRLDSLSRGFSTHPEPMNDVAPCKEVEGLTSKPAKPANQRKDATAPVNPWGPIFKNREHFVEIHLR